MAGPVGPPFVFPSHFQVVGHFLGNANGETWRSEVTVEASTVPQPSDQVIQTARDYFLHNLRSDCTLDHIELRQWTYGPQPLNGRGALWTQPYQLTGEKVTTYGGEQASPALTGKEVVAFVEHNTTGGKPGKQFIRQLLDLGDVGAVAGAPWEFLPSSRVTPAKFTNDAGLLWNPFIATATLPRLVVVHFSKKNYNNNPVSSNLPFSTTVLSLTLVGVTTNRPTRKSKR